MKRRYILVVILGKFVRYISRLFGHGGSALPGLIIEKLAPEFLSVVLNSLPDGVIVVVGTNGKTTTTKIITELLAAEGKQVLTNSTGSNFTRGIIATIINEFELKDRSLKKDIAVLELDEAYGRLFVEQIKPEYVVALNVMRDQLDRFGELDITRRLIASILQAATRGCVINGDEPELVTVGYDLKLPVHYYGVAADLRRLFPTDAELLKASVNLPKSYRPDLSVELEAFSGQHVNYRIDNHIYSLHMTLKGQYNFHNGAAALAIVRMVMPDVNVAHWQKTMEKVEPAFGRGEIIKIGEQSVELVLVKNPGSFRQALASHDLEALTMVAINDNHADGRDVSWLWDVDFTQYNSKVYVVSGTRATDIALRLQYDNIDPQYIEADLMGALNHLLEAHSTLPRRIFCTYTAMLTVRNQISQLTTLAPSL